MGDFIKAALLGIVEGMTEFLPVSSTGHLLLLQRFLGFGDEDFGKTFVVLIQLGAILAILTIYFHKLWGLATGMFSDPAARRFVIGVLIAFLPAALIGAVMHSIIKEYLFNAWVVCFTLIAGGAVLLWVDQIEFKPRFRDVMQFSLPMCLIIGVCQCFAMIPGVSRSGATIVSAMLLGADKRSAAEFSFFLAMPTMTGAFALDLIKNHDQMTSHNVMLVAIGFACSFVAGYFVVKTFLDYVSRHGFGLFAWWRVVVGSIGLLLLAIGF
jgi:undecaprenyl-diphosphatase